MSGGQWHAAMNSESGKLQKYCRFVFEKLSAEPTLEHDAGWICTHRRPTERRSAERRGPGSQPPGRQLSCISSLRITLHESLPPGCSPSCCPSCALWLSAFQTGLWWAAPEIVALLTGWWPEPPGMEFGGGGVHSPIDLPGKFRLSHGGPVREFKMSRTRRNSYWTH